MIRRGPLRLVLLALAAAFAGLALSVAVSMYAIGIEPVRDELREIGSGAGDSLGRATGEVRSVLGLANPGPREYEVFRTVVDYELPKEDRSWKLGVLDRTAYRDARAVTELSELLHENDHDEAVALEPSTVRDFLQRNRATGSVDPARLGERAEFLGTGAIDRMLRSEGDAWALFEKTYPHVAGVLRLSRVGFSADGRQALVSFSLRCGTACCSDGYLVLDAGEEGWAVAADYQLGGCS